MLISWEEASVWCLNQLERASLVKDMADGVLLRCTKGGDFESDPDLFLPFTLSSLSRPYAAGRGIQMMGVSFFHRSIMRREYFASKTAQLKYSSRVPSSIV